MQRPALSAVTELFKPITWFPPMWAFACGVVASGVSLQDRWWMAIVGIALAGPLVCATSQAVNDWFDRHVDAINEPQRPIPSGRMPGQWGLYLAIAWTGVSLLVALALGPWGFGAAALGLSSTLGALPAMAQATPKKGGTLKLTAKNRQNKDLVININLSGFTASYDGEATMTFDE